MIIIVNQLFVRPVTYLFLPPKPKKCPSDSADFKGVIEDDLQAAGRLIDNQIQRLVAYFDDVQSTETDTEKSHSQNDAISQLKSCASQTTARAGSSTNTAPVTSSRTSQLASANVFVVGLQNSGSDRVNAYHSASIPLEGGGNFTIKVMQGCDLVVRRNARGVSGQTET